MEKSKEILAFNIFDVLQEEIGEEFCYDYHRLARRIIDVLPYQTFDATQPFEEGRIYFSGEICTESAANFVEELDRVDINLNLELDIEVYLNSGGGDVQAAQAMINAIQRLQLRDRNVNIHVHGMAASMASILVQVGTRRTIARNAIIMLHELSYAMRGKTSNHAQDLKFTETWEKELCSYYTTRTSVPVEKYLERIKGKDIYIFAEDALAEGLVDSIDDVPLYPITPPKSGSLASKPRVRKAKSV